MSETGRCRDCRRWEDFQGDPSLSKEAASRGESGFCNKIAVERVRGDGPRDGAYIVAIYDPDGIEKPLGRDDSDLCHINLSTGPDFGCVQFEAREPAGKESE
jgi:hypothetical protein